MPSADALLQRARRLLWLTLLPPLLLVLLLAGWQALAQWRQVLDGASAQARSQGYALEVVAREAINHVADLRHWMQQELLHAEEPPAPAVAQSLRPRQRGDGRGQPGADGSTDAPTTASSTAPTPAANNAAAADTRADGHTLDALPELLRGGMAQVLWPPERGEQPPTEELRRAQALSAVFDLAHRRSAALAASYFVGWPERHLVLFPWLPSAAIVQQQQADSLADALNRWYDTELVRAGLPDANPTRETYWTAPLIRSDGPAAATVAHAAPLYTGDNLRGIVATEIQLATLQRLLLRLPDAPWSAWLVDDRGHVLADRQLAKAQAQAQADSEARAAAAASPDQAGASRAEQALPDQVLAAARAATDTMATLRRAITGQAEPGESSGVPLLAQRLPAGIDIAAIRQAAAAGGSVVALGDQRLVAFEIGGTPWTLVLAASRHGLLLATLPQVLPYSMIVAGLLGAWLLGQGLLRQRIFTPMVAVLGYLQRLSADADAREPALGRRWQPWVQVISRTFASMRQAARGEQRAEALKSAIVDHAQAAVVVADEHGLVVEFNPAAEALFGCNRDAAIGRNVIEMMTPARFRDSLARALLRMRSGDPEVTMGRRLQRTLCRADGSEFVVEVVLWMTEVDGEAYYTASINDQTAARAAAEVIERQRDALRQSEKLTAMGSLLAGVAHELNNPLAIVMGRASLLEEKTEGSPLQADAQRIREAAERCGRIVRTFLNMARSRPAQRSAVQLNDLARAAADMLGYTLRSHGIDLELRLANDLPELQADGDQIGQVVLNLIVNAQQALATHGGPRRISVYTGRGSAAAPGAEAQGEARGAAVWLRVADSGPGVAAEVRDKIFEPFFTTKAEGMGTGMGLSVSRAIVRDHGGELLLEAASPNTANSATSGPGASFLLSLPLQAAAPVSAPGAAADTATDTPPARLLVVDDEPEITDLMRQMLEAAGHEVATADSGALALALLDSARFDAIISDLRMPDMDGAALWRAVRQQQPALARRMVFVTGDTLSAGARQFLDDTGCAHLDKPFARADLLAQVARVLQTDAPND